MITVTDSIGAAVVQAKAEIHNPVTDYTQNASSDATGKLRFVNGPPNQYHLAVEVSGFAPFTQDVTIFNSVPMHIRAKLSIAGSATTGNVESQGADLTELDPSAHVDVDRSTIARLPIFDPGANLSQAVAYSRSGVAADANGFFHPLGDYAQVQFNIDRQPITISRAKCFPASFPQAPFRA